MAVELTQMWVVKCDTCGEFLDTTGDWSFECWLNEEDAKQALADDGYWVREGDKVQCGDCWERQQREKEEANAKQ